MRVQFSKVIVAVATLSVLSLGSIAAQTQEPAQGGAQAQQPAQGGAQAQGPQWKDRAEYDLVQAITKETDPQKKLALLNEWTQKYPNTDFKQTRLEEYMNAYRLANDPAKMLEADKTLLKEFPKSATGQYWACMLVVSMNTGKQANPEDLQLAQGAAQGLLAMEKPAAVTDDQWRQQKQQMDIIAHRTLGWVAMQQKNWDVAEKEFTDELKMNPADAQASYWLGTSILQQKKPERQSEALYYFARAAAYDGPGALDPKARQQMEAYIQKAYTNYHGQDPQGFQQLLAQAKTNPFPPAGFKILSADEVAAQQHAALQAKDPALALWVTIKSALTGPDGANYFDQSVKNAVIPPEGQPAFKGTVVTATPKKIEVGVENANAPEATLVPPEGETYPKVEPGTVLTFRGITTAYTAQPFNLTFEAARKSVTGWPAPPAKKAPPRKAVRRK